MATYKRGPKAKPGGRAAEFAQLRAENERLRQRVQQLREERREYREATHSGIQAVAVDFRTASAHCAACADKDRTIKELIKVYKDDQGLMTTKMYTQILALLHPDRVTDVELKRRYNKVFIFWKGLEKIIPFELTYEERTGTPRAKMPPPMPMTTREMSEAREKVRQERSERAKRAAAKRKAKKGQ